MNSVLQPVDAELTRLNTKVSEDNLFIAKLQNDIEQYKKTVEQDIKQLSEANKSSVFKPELYSNLHKGIFIQPSNTGNTGGGSDKPHGQYKLVSGDTTVVSITPSAPYDNFYFYSNPVPSFSNDWTRFEWGAEFSFPTQKDLDSNMALEWEIELCLNGTVWNMGWQILLQYDGRDNPGFRLFDYNRSAWISQPGIPLDKTMLTPGKVLKVSSEHIVSRVNNDETHLALTIGDAARYFVGFNQKNTPNRWPAGANYLHWSFQLDSDGHGTPYSVNLNNGYMKVL